MNPVTERINKENEQKYGKICTGCNMFKTQCTCDSYKNFKSGGGIKGIKPRKVLTDEKKNAIKEFTKHLKDTYKIAVSNEVLEKFFKQYK